jgi:hypothetical protein
MNWVNMNTSQIDRAWATCNANDADRARVASLNRMGGDHPYWTLERRIGLKPVPAVGSSRPIRQEIPPPTPLTWGARDRHAGTALARASWTIDSQSENVLRFRQLSPGQPQQDGAARSNGTVAASRDLVAQVLQRAAGEPQDQWQGDELK